MRLTEEINNILRIAGVNRCLLVEGLEEVKKYFPSIPTDMFQQIAQLDPTYQGGNELGKYCKWLFTRYNQMYKQGMKPTIDTDIKDLLTTYNNFKKEISKPIDSIKSFDELEQITNQYKGKTPELSNRQKKIEIRQDVKKFYEDDEWLVIIPKTKEASCLYGANTKWRTAGREKNMFNYYKKQGPLYININKKTGEKYQFQFQSKEYRDAQDDFVDLSEVFMKMPKELQEKYVDYGIRYDNKIISYIDNPSEKLQLKAIQYDDGRLKGIGILKYIVNPTEKAKLEAVEKNGFNIQYIDNPTEEMKLLAVKNDGYAIKYIEKPSENVQLEAIYRTPDAFKYIENPSEDVQKEAVRSHPRTIQYIENPSDKVRQMAFSNHIDAIYYIKNPTEEIELEAVKQHGMAIAYIKNPSENVKLEAVKNDGNAIFYIKNPSEKVQLEAVKQTLNAYKNIKNPAPSVTKYYEEHK